MKRRSLVLATALLAAAVAHPATANAATVDRVCITSGSATAAQITAYQVNGTSDTVRMGFCSSSTSDLKSFYIGGIPCTSQWGGHYAADTTYSASLLNGDLSLRCI